jgi:prophage DNA circulation protein
MLTIWQEQLLPASFRGVPFVVLDTNLRGGRRVVEHSYPFRDVPWAEDLGRSARRISFDGFVVGDDAGAQRDALATACEQKGPGPLVHPTKGFIQVACQEFETEERWDKGRVIKFRFVFVEAGELLFPGTNTDTQANSTASALGVDTAANQDVASSSAAVDGSPAPTGQVDIGLPQIVGLTPATPLPDLAGSTNQLVVVNSQLKLNSVPPLVSGPALNPPT